MNNSTFRIFVTVPRSITIKRKKLDRDEFFVWLWREFSGKGILGVHEGTLLSEQAHDAGFEATASTIDAKEAPANRDWVENQSEVSAELYFASLEEALGAIARLKKIQGLQVSDNVEEQLPRDWDAQWKASFSGVKVAPFWEVLPPWKKTEANISSVPPPGQSMNLYINLYIRLYINPGAGFGTGTHETTQLCLESLGELSLKGKAILDFGSGSGILSIGAALLGAKVDAVEIDQLANENAQENEKLNGVEHSIRILTDLSDAPGPYSLVIANILKPVLLEFAEPLVKRLEPGGTLILSGLIEPDVRDVYNRYSELLSRKPTVHIKGEWRALVWQ